MYGVYLPGLASNPCQRRPGTMIRRSGSRPSGNRREGDDNASQIANSGTRPDPVPRPHVHRPDERGGMQDRWRLFEERARTEPFGFPRFPLQPPSPIRILVFGSGTSEMLNPRLQQFIRDAPTPRIRDQWETGFTPHEEDAGLQIRGQWETGFIPHEEEPGLSNTEFKRAMSKLRRHIFNPPYPTKRAYKRGLFSNISSRNNSHADNDDDDEEDDGKDCTICLDEFVPNQQVLVTPCNHMFHNECITPWVKSHGKCPVCRFVLGESREQSRSNNAATFAFIRAMDWVNAPPY